MIGLREHNREVLGGLLGMSDAEIGTLEAEGVIARRENARKREP